MALAPLWRSAVTSAVVALRSPLRASASAAVSRVRPASGVAEERASGVGVVSSRTRIWSTGGLATCGASARIASSRTLGSCIRGEPWSSAATSASTASAVPIAPRRWTPRTRSSVSSDATSARPTATPILPRSPPAASGRAGAALAAWGGAARGGTIDGRRTGRCADAAAGASTTPTPIARVRAPRTTVPRRRVPPAAPPDARIAPWTSDGPSSGARAVMRRDYPRAKPACPRGVDADAVSLRGRRRRRALPGAAAVPCRARASWTLENSGMIPRESVVSRVW